MYLATWNQTQVAVKLLLGEGAATENTAEAAERALSPDNPLLASLQQVGGACAWVGLKVLLACNE